MKPGDAGNLAFALDAVEWQGRAELATDAFEAANGKAEGDPWEDDGAAGALLGRAEW